MAAEPTLFDVAGPPDQAERDRIRTELDTTMLVEAAAGTGKTTCLMRRMVELLAEGRCTIDTMAAVTFTRKATAELRARFQVALEKESRTARGPRRDRLRRALDRVEQCFIGTIHSFCGRLLRERPIEAGVDIAFEELDEDAEFRLRRAAWDEYAARLHADGSPLLAELDELGLSLGELKEAYVEFADYPDVERWPAGEVVIDDRLAEGARAALRAYAAYMEGFGQLPRHAGNDMLMPLFHDLPLRLRHTRLGRLPELMQVLADVASTRVVQKEWPGGNAQGKREHERLKAFRREYAEPLLAQWQRRRYGPVLKVLRGAVEVYDGLRTERGALSYQDLLMKAAALLCGHSHVRAYFRRRFTHLLVDEFQDTDPVQAQVMLLLTADDTQEPDWRRCRPVDGSLFVVGDPKQSIYRFRRADIVTFNEVRAIIEACGTLVVLTANFRTIPPLVRWFNSVSRELFAAPCDYSPKDNQMEPARAGAAEGDCTGVRRLDLPATRKSTEAAAYEVEAVARWIRDALERRLTVPRTPDERARDAPDHVVPGDFLVLTWVRSAVTPIARRLEADGVPVDVTGGAAVNEVEEVALLHSLLRAVVEADNPVALVGLLRSPLFGTSDTALYEFSRAGGEFSYRRAQAAAGIRGAEPIAEALARLDRYARWLAQMQPIAAVERMASDLGLFARAVTGADGLQTGGVLCTAIELLRAAAREHWTPAAIADYLWSLVDPARWPQERHDGLPLRPHDGGAVRVMNLHQAKGLEAPIVVLADGFAKPPAGFDLHVDRRHGEVRGYLRVRGARRGEHGSGQVLALPVEWDAIEQEERLFREAETDRLLYVAATRAGSQLVISRAASGGRWRKLAGAVTPDDALVVPDRAAPPHAVTETLPAGAPQAFETERNRRLAAIARPTYDVRRLKALVVTGAAPGGPGAPGEHGTEWGTVVHALLEAAMVTPHSDLGALAASALREHDLDERRAGEAVALVEQVVRSDLWSRARSARRCLTEVPIQMVEPAGDDARAVDTIVRGVIDLVFREERGWVIVDYKTDDRAGRDLDGLVEHYAPQVRAYAEAWRRLSGDPVHETGLFFVRTGAYRRV